MLQHRVITQTLQREGDLEEALTSFRLSVAVREFLRTVTQALLIGSIGP
jgi:hypothetical protein